MSWGPCTYVTPLAIVRAFLLTRKGGREGREKRGGGEIRLTILVCLCGGDLRLLMPCRSGMSPSCLSRRRRASSTRRETVLTSSNKEVIITRYYVKGVWEGGERGGGGRRASVRVCVCVRQADIKNPCLNATASHWLATRRPALFWHPLSCRGPPAVSSRSCSSRCGAEKRSTKASVARRRHPNACTTWLSRGPPSSSRANTQDPLPT